MTAEKILIADADDVVLFDLRLALEKKGYEVAGLTSSCQEVVRLVEDASPALVLMDVHLQEGAGVADAAAEIERLHGVPVVFLGADIQDEALVRQDGPCGFLLKPVKHGELGTAVEVGLYKRRMMDKLRRAHAAADAASGAKTSFLATVSHELRTPMNGVLGMAELLLLSDLDEPYKENVQLIKDSAMSLLSVLNQIIDYSKLESSALKLRETDFRIEDIVTGVLSQYARSAEDKGVAVKYTMDEKVPGWLRGDSAKLRQVIANLVSNAMKFTHFGQVLVDVSSAESDSGEGDDVFGVRLTVQDTGVGIPTESLGGVFECFNLAEDHLSHASGGLGLGLAIVNRLVGALGGAINYSSEEGKGSAFSVTIPLKPSQYELHDPSEDGAINIKPLDGVRALVAEDDFINQRYIVRLLEKLGGTVSLVDNGRQAVEVLCEEVFDVVLMDVEMPLLDGIEATRMIRDPETGCLDADVPIIALTAHAMWGDEQRCSHAGMDDYVTKPVDMNTIASIIRSNLASR